MPTTTAGKAIAARNATSHGLFARDIVLPTLGEDPGAYDALLDQFTQQITPCTLLERHYVEQIACASWRLRRLHRWQAQLYEDPNLTEDQRLDRLDRVLRHETSLTRQIDRAVKMLARELTPLTEGRARRDALAALEATEEECRKDPTLAYELQQKIAETLTPDGAAVAFDLERLDNTQPRPKICQNEPAQPRFDECGRELPDLSRDVDDLHPDGRPIFLTRQAWENQKFHRQCGDIQKADEDLAYFRDSFLRSQEIQRRQQSQE